MRRFEPTRFQSIGQGEGAIGQVSLSAKSSLCESGCDIQENKPDPYTCPGPRTTKDVENFCERKGAVQWKKECEGCPEQQIASEAAEAIGRFVVVWGSVEHELEGIISGMYLMVPVMRSCLTIGLTLDPKLNLIRDGLVKTGYHLLGDTQRKEYIRIIDEVRKLVGNYRNTVFHSSIMPESTQGLRAGKFKGGNNSKLVFIDLKKEYFDNAIREMGACRDQLRSMRETITVRYRKMRSAFLQMSSSKELEKELHFRKLRRFDFDLSVEEQLR